MTEDELKARALEHWRIACLIADQNPDLDRGDVFHVLESLDLLPIERLTRGLICDCASSIDTREVSLAQGPQ